MIMVSQPLHTGMLPARRISAVILVVIYLAIIVSPLASFALTSKAFAHAFSGECTGDCEIDGCSRESRANHSCCCARKRQQAASFSVTTARGDCCSSVPTPKPADQSGCAASKPHQQAEKAVMALPVTPKPHSSTVYSCGSPCGKGKLVALATDSSELLPSHFNEMCAAPAEYIFPASLQHDLVSRHLEPPDPPPRITVTV